MITNLGFSDLTLNRYMKTAYAKVKPQYTEALTNALSSASKVADNPTTASLSEEQNGLTSAQIGELTRKYDPQNMTQKEYDRFLDDLCELGVIEEADKQALGHSAYQSGATPITEEELHQMKCSVMDVSDISTPNEATSISDRFDEVNGKNALLWTLYQSSWQVIDQSTGMWTQNDEARLFSNIHSILEQIDSQR